MTTAIRAPGRDALNTCASNQGSADTQPRDEFFNPSRLPVSPAAQRLVAEVLTRLQGFEAERLVRQRKRRAADQAIFEQTVTALVCDLIHGELTQVDWIAVPRSKTVLARKSRYSSPIFGKQFPKVLDLLADPDLGMVEQVIGYWSSLRPGERTVVRAGEQLRTLILDHGLTLRDLGSDWQDEAIVLKALVRPGSHRKTRIDYPETAGTTRMRREMETINQRLLGADLALIVDGVDHPEMIQARRLRRVFTQGSFRSGGRLYDGFWEPLRKEVRRSCLRIDGETTVELDYGQMALRLLYGHAGVTPSWEDGYLVPLPGLEDGSHLFRDGMKKLINSMLFSDKPLSRKPKGTKGLLPGFLSIGQLTQAVLDAHRPVAHLFHTGIGHYLQFLESELMVDLLLEAGERGITALPIHDAIIVRRSQAMEAKTLMEEVFQRRTRLEAVVKVDND